MCYRSARTVKETKAKTKETIPHQNLEMYSFSYDRERIGKQIVTSEHLNVLLLSLSTITKWFIFFHTHMKAER